MDTEFSISFEDFGDGLSPLAHIDNKTFKGSKGQASEMRADVISNPGFLQQSPALADLTNGNQSGVVTEQIRYILDKPTATDTTYALGTSKLFKLSSTTVASGGTPSWPQEIRETMLANSYSLQLTRASSQYVYITDAAQKGLDLSGDFTIEAWVKVETDPTSGQIYTIASKDNSDTNISYNLFYYNDGQSKQINIVISGDGTGNKLDKVHWNYDLGTNWHHVAVTCQINKQADQKFELFIDGVSRGNGIVDSNDGVSSIFNSTASFAIGASFNAGVAERFFDGKINNLRVWSLVRSGNQILLGKDRVITQSGGLVGSWYRTNNHYDMTSNSNTLTPSGSPTFSSDVPFTSSDLVMAEGESLIRLKNNLFIFYNRTSDGDIAAMPLDTQSIDAAWGSKTDQELEKAKHPVAAKEDIMVFGNGRYLGVYIEGSAILDVKKLDFGEGAEIADVVFHANMWWIAVNYGEGRRSQIYLYDGSAMSNILSDEVGLGSQRIGFLFVLNGIVYVAYDDLTATGFAIGWISGRQLKPLRYFSGTLPDHRQKTLYKNTILFVSGSDIYSFGAPVEQVPIQISRLASGGYTNIGGIAAPFGTPMIASSNGTGSYRLAQFSGLSTTGSYWKSVFVDTTKNRKLGKIHTVIVSTKALESGARADLTLEGNQGAITSNTMQITGANKTRHVFRNVSLKAVEDVRVAIDFQNGSSTKNCPIRKIELLGNFVER